ncbi:hypothetical protein N9N28_17695 [Rubripirellula amarantea]|nr:hypothetical protein [Rubripirellula amarantea]
MSGAGQSDNGSVLRAAAIDLQANGKVCHRRSVTTVGYPLKSTYDTIHQRAWSARAENNDGTSPA